MKPLEQELISQMKSTPAEEQSKNFHGYIPVIDSLFGQDQSFGEKVAEDIKAVERTQDSYMTDGQKIAIAVGVVALGIGAYIVIKKFAKKK